MPRASKAAKAKQLQWLIQIRRQLWTKKKEPNGKKFVRGWEFSLRADLKMGQLLNMLASGKLIKKLETENAHFLMGHPLREK